MKMQQLLMRWQSLSRPSEARISVHAELGHHDVARLQALAEMYPGSDVGELLVDLLQAALNEMEEAFPYVHGSRQVGEDEFGEPIYEDIGPTPRFLALTRKHLKALEGSQETHRPTGT